MPIQDIKAEIQQLQNALNAENQRGALKDGAKVVELEKRIEDLTQELEVEQRAEQYAQSKEDATVQVATMIDSLDWEGVNPRDLFLNRSEDSATESLNYFAAVVQNAFVASKQADLLRIKEFEEQNIVAQVTAANLQAKIDQLELANGELKRELSTMELNFEDAESKRTAAANLLDEANKEIERLNSNIDDLRIQNAVGARGSMNVIDVKSAKERWEEQKKLDEEQKRLEEEAKPLIYNLRWKDPIKKTHYLANLVFGDEEIEIHYLQMSGDIEKPTEMTGRYRVVAAEQVPTFRAEYLATQQEEQHSENDNTHDIPEDGVTVTAFRGEDSTASGLDQTNTSGAVAGSTVEERLQALELRVFGEAKNAA